ncbi:hypothetical protein Esti_000994 [Eimeria stiedai]
MEPRSVSASTGDNMLLCGGHGSHRFPLAQFPPVQGPLHPRQALQQHVRHSPLPVSSPALHLPLPFGSVKTPARDFAIPLVKLQPPCRDTSYSCPRLKPRCKLLFPRFLQAFTSLRSMICISLGAQKRLSDWPPSIVSSSEDAAVMSGAATKTPRGSSGSWTPVPDVVTAGGELSQALDSLLPEECLMPLGSPLHVSGWSLAQAEEVAPEPQALKATARPQIPEVAPVTTTALSLFMSGASSIWAWSLEAQPPSGWPSPKASSP